MPSVHPFYHTLAHIKTKNEAEYVCFSYRAKRKCACYLFSSRQLIMNRYSIQTTPTQESTSGVVYLSQLCLRLQNLYPLDSLSDKNALLLEIAKDTLRNDWSSALTYLLALPDPSLASPLFDELVSLQLKAILREDKRNIFIF